MRLLVPAALSVALVACGGGDDAMKSPSQADPGGGRDGVAVVLRTGQVVSVPQESLSLQMTEVHDSRCPIDAVCVWAGHASIAVTATQPGQATETLQLGLPAPAELKLPGEARYRSLRLTLQQLDPAPRAATPTPLEQYRATVLVQRAQ
ncbi:MAG: hypothetical protein HY855_23345 [Burkholderiales bacterium]|nr:hypothetical protein [Burkholderiales bacterium]